MKKKNECDNGIVYLSLVEAADLRGCTKQALYFAIRKQVLGAVKIKGFWKVTPEALLKYDSELYCRMNRSKANGEYIYDREKGKITTELAARLVGLTRQNIYYALRTGKLKYKRVNGAIVIDMKDLFKFRKPVSYDTTL